MLDTPCLTFLPPYSTIDVCSINFCVCVQELVQLVVLEALVVQEALVELVAQEALEALVELVLQEALEALVELVLQEVIN